MNSEKHIFGFWIYLMTDCVLFTALFATFAVLRTPAQGALFSAPFVLVETLILLTSSFTCGLSLLAAETGKKTLALLGLIITFALGATFVFLEVSEFARLASEGHSWQHDGGLSSYFTLVGTHGLHVTAGLLWMLTLIIALSVRGLTSMNLRKLTMLTLFWHFLDVIWIFIFTIVYLMGML